METKKIPTRVWIAGAFVPVFISLTLGAMHFHDRSKRFINVIIIPICNPGRSCPPELPKQLSNDFFDHPRGVAHLLSELMAPDIVVKGQVSPWIRASQKLKSSHEIVSEIPVLLEDISLHTNLDKFQVILFTIDTPGVQKNILWPRDKTLKINQTQLGPRIGIIINSLSSKSLNSSPLILPSPVWLETTATLVGLAQSDYQLCL